MCKREWNERTSALVFTGPNGNSISFHCKSNNKTYWLNAYEQGDTQFSQCFHIGPDGLFMSMIKTHHLRYSLDLSNK